MTGPAPRINVDTGSVVAPYEQIRHQLDQLIRDGHLPPGQRLPTVRQLATDLGLAAGTVARAYRELELAGRVRTRRGGGTAVAGNDEAVAGGEALAPLAAAYVAQARRLGASDRDLIRAVRNAL